MAWLVAVVLVVALLLAVARISEKHGRELQKLEDWLLQGGVPKIIAASVAKEACDPERGFHPGLDPKAYSLWQLDAYYGQSLPWERDKHKPEQERFVKQMQARVPFIEEKYLRKLAYDLHMEHGWKDFVSPEIIEKYAKMYANQRG